MAPRRSVDRQRFVEQFNLSLVRGVPTGGRIRQRDVADRLGINAQTVSRWSRGETLPSDTHVEQLRRLFGWTDDEYAALFRRSTSVQVGVDFERWREAVGLGSSFPRLGRIPPSRPAINGATDSSNMWFSGGNRAVIEEDINASGVDRLAVVTTPGHGGTTLARHIMSRRQSEALKRKEIPVLVSIEDLLGVDYDALLDLESDFLRFAHPRAGEGVWNPDRDWVIGEADTAAAQLLGGDVDQLALPSLPMLVQRAATESLATLSWQRVLGDRRLRELKSIVGSDVEAFLDNSFARVALIADLTPTPMGRQFIDPAVDEHITPSQLELTTRLVHDALVLGSHPSVDLMLVVDGRTWRDLDPQMTEGFERVDLPPYEPTEVFAILARHYFPGHYAYGSNRPEEWLATVLDLEYLNKAPNKGLSTQMWLLETMLRADVVRPGVSYFRSAESVRSDEQPLARAVAQGYVDPLRLRRIASWAAATATQAEQDVTATPVTPRALELIEALDREISEGGEA